MKYYLISDNTDTLTGLRLAGIEGALASTRRDVACLIETVRADDTIAVLLVTEACYALCRELIDSIKLSVSRPLVSVIPAAGETRGDTGSITRLIREAIGVKI